MEDLPAAEAANTARCVGHRVTSLIAATCLSQSDNNGLFLEQYEKDVIGSADNETKPYICVCIHNTMVFLSVYILTSYKLLTVGSWLLHSHVTLYPSLQDTALIFLIDKTNDNIQRQYTPIIDLILIPYANF